MSDKKIVKSIEDIMGERFGRYSKYIIQDRALPDVRDGLKPVQRRILYAMYHEGNTHQKPYRKCAKSVGVVIGNYHPHGDSSVYEAMVRLSQDWKMRIPLVDMQGNNGSIDNDPAAAMRYTEARLSAIANELLKDLDKDTVPMSLNFDDTEYEPTVLPAKFPNLLVNGSTGISAGYATDIPPHNLQEVIDATILRINQPNCTLEEIMNHMLGPDFPTGGIAMGKEGILEAFKTGKGKVAIRAKTEINESKKSMNEIIITEIPYEVNKAELVRKIDDIRFNRLVDGIIEVRDESDRSGLRVVVEIKKDISADNIVNFLFKNTDLQKNYNYNIVAINDKRPEQMGVVSILDAYIYHQIEVITKRSLYDLDKSRARLHIVDGLIKAVSILDEVVATIRKSKDKADAKHNIIKKYDFTEKQAEAIVMLQLYRLTNTDIVALEHEKTELDAIIYRLNQILDHDSILRQVIVDELTYVKNLYPSPRLTEIKDEVLDITIDKEAMIIADDVYISITRDGYVKRISQKSYKASDKTSFGKKEDDYLLDLFYANTLDKLLLFTNKGNYLYIPVYQLEEFRWKDVGKHISYLVKVNSEEKIIASILVNNFDNPIYVTMASKTGKIKRTLLKEFEVQRYSKAMKCFNLKADDELIGVQLSDGNKGVSLVTRQGYAVMYSEQEISTLGLKAAGIKGISMKMDEVVSLLVFDPIDNLSMILVSDKAVVKRIRLTDLKITSRTVKGQSLYMQTKTNSQEIFKAVVLKVNDLFVVYTSNLESYEAFVKDYNYGDLSSRMGTINKVDDPYVTSFIYTDYRLIEYEVKKSKHIEMNQKFDNQEEQFIKLSIDDFLK